MLVTPNQQVHPFGELVRMYTAFIVSPGPLALVPVLVDQHNVEGIGGRILKTYVFGLE